MIEYDQLAEQYATNRQIHPGVLDALRRSIRPGDTVLEVGCGTGNYIGALSPGAACWGCDLSAGMLAQARAKGVPLWMAQAEYTGCRDDRFDLAFSVDVIHHLPRPAAYFREMGRILRPGGRICTVTDSAWIIRHRRPLSDYFPETVPLELDRYPRLSQLRQWMERAGFQNLAEEMVEFTYPVTDSRPYRDKSFSALHLIPATAFQRGLQKMEQDLQAGPIPGLARYVLLWGERR